MSTFVLRRLLALLIPILLTACATAPREVLTPVALETVPPDASELTILVATSRKPTGDPGTLFSGERSPLLSLANIDISIPPESARKAGTVQWPRRLPPDPRREFAVTGVQPRTPAEARQWLHQRDTGSGRVLVFVHGFNNRFADALFRFAQIVHELWAQMSLRSSLLGRRAAVFSTMSTTGRAQISRARPLSAPCRHWPPTPR